MNITERLFSYGTLQKVEVQLETFGRELVGSSDVLLGYRLGVVEITDQSVIELSSESHHPIAVITCDHADEIPGMVFEITADELAQSDEYEVDEVYIVTTSGFTRECYSFVEGKNITLINGSMLVELIQRYG